MGGFEGFEEGLRGLAGVMGGGGVWVVGDLENVV